MLKLKELRKKEGISQLELSKLIGYDQSVISQWENGTRDPNTDVLLKLSSLFMSGSEALERRRLWRFRTLAL